MPSSLEVRTKLRQSQSEFAKTLSVTVRTVSRWETGSPPTAKLQQAIDDLAVGIWPARDVRASPPLKLKPHPKRDVGLAKQNDAALAIEARHRKDSKPDAMRGLKVTVMEDQSRVDVQTIIQQHCPECDLNPCCCERQWQVALPPEPNSDRQHLVDHTLGDSATPRVSLSDRMRQMREAE